MTKTIVISIRKSDETISSKGVTGTTVKGTPFAITQAHGWNERWSLTHLPTGFRVAGASTQMPLRTMAKRLAELPSAQLNDADAIKADGPAWLPIIRESLYGATTK